MDFDVVIVGAGPAGATAALNLAPTRRVALVDSRAVATPRIGESLPTAARRLFADMGLLESFEREGHSPCYGNRFSWGGGPEESDSLRNPDGSGWHLDRARFEAWLRGVAAERGAALLIPGRLENIERLDGGFIVTLDSRTVTASFVIDAGGRAAPVARRLGAHCHVEDRLICRWAAGHDRNSKAAAGLTYVEAEEEGWWYTAPLPGHRRMLAFHTDSDLPAAHAVRDRDELLFRARGQVELAKILECCGFVDEGEDGTTVAASSVLDPCMGEGWLAVGDAALSFDPLSSQGIFNALFTGLAAALTVDRLLSSDASAAGDYSATIDGIYRAYRRHLDYWYGAEHRWPQSPFWMRRQDRGRAA